MEKPLTINWFGTTSQGQGFSGSGEKMIIALEKAGADVRVVTFSESVNITPEGEKIRRKPFQLGEVGIVYGFPTSFSSLFNNKYKIGFTMFETDKLPNSPEGKPNEWAGMTGNAIDAVNDLDMLFVPSTHNRWLFKKEGAKVPVEVVPLGVDIDFYKKVVRPKRKTFTFLMLGTLTIRKNPGIAFNAFVELFKNRPDVRIIFKTQSGTLAHFTTPYGNVKIVDEYTTTEKMIEYYTEADCFIFPSRGEGFGLPPLEAMCTGLPVIMADNTGMTDFCNREYNYPIPCFEKEKAIRYPIKWGDVGNWYEPDYLTLKDIMSYVVEHQEEAYNKGLAGADWARKMYNFDNTAQVILSKIDKLKKIKSIN